MSIVDECEEVLDWIRSKTNERDEVYLKMKMIKATLQGWGNCFVQKNDK